MELDQEAVNNQKMPSGKKRRTHATSTESIRDRNRATLRKAELRQRAIWCAEERRWKVITHPGFAADKLSVYRTGVPQASPPRAVDATRKIERKRGLCLEAIR